MDPNSTPQTVAQAVQAATQQAQQAVSHSSPAVQPPQTSQTTTIDNLTCQWQGCGERCDSAEALYDHVCESHVGRKSTNNLNLTCQWGACRTTTVKRDHITSHIRVHVPLKPHKCDFCGKAFKRPQDLKKHVKTHADDSVIMNSPQGQNGRGLGTNGGLGQPNGKPATYYPGHDASLNSHYNGYQANMAANAASNGFPQTAGSGQYAGYGSVSYPNSSAVADIQSMDTRRRAIEALNDFLGDIKRRAIDPNTYYDVGQRLHSNALPLPVGPGYNTGYNNSGYSANNNNNNTTNNNNGGFGNTASLLAHFNNGTHLGVHGDPQGGLTSPTYSLPLPNARTKNDLQDIDRFLEQLQATVYETSNQAGQAGVQQAGTHTTIVGDYGLGGHHQTHYHRASHSPPSSYHGGGNMSGYLSSASSMSGMSAPSPGNDTPAQTPDSVSYTSGHSPMSSHSRVSFGSSGNNQYPNLPSVTGISDMDSGYPSTTSAPASGLSAGFGIDGHRLSGGYLQKQAPPPAQDTIMEDAEEDGARTPRADSDADRPKSKSHSALDPALRGDEMSETTSTPTAQSEGADDKRQEEWVENIRVIEALRKWIGERLDTGDFEQLEGAAAGDAKITSDVDMKTVETAKMVAETLAVEEKAAKEVSDDHVNYPSLPTA